MILSAFLIDGKAVGIELNSWDGNIIPFKAEDNLSDGYADISSIENWDRFTVLDWSRRRDEISILFYIEAGTQLQNFTGISTVKKIIACKYFLIPYSIRIKVVGDTQDAINWSYLLAQTKISRIDCIEAMRVQTGQYMRTGFLTLSQTQQFYKDVFNMVRWFEDANVPDFKSWL